MTFNIDAPAPFSKFEDWTQSEQNAQLESELLNPSGDVRKILNKTQLKRFQDVLTRIDESLTSAGIMNLLSTHDSLKSDWQDLVSNRYELMKRHESGEPTDIIRDEYHHLKEHAQTLKTQRKQLNQQLRPYRKYILLKRRIEARITEHETALKDDQVARENRRLMELEVNSVAEIIIHAANGADYCFRTTYKGKERIVRIQFGRVIATPDEIQIKIHAASRGLFGGFRWDVPRSVSIPQMMKDENFIAQLSGAIGMPVSCPQVETGKWQQGYWLRIQRNGLLDGIREHVSYAEYIKRYPNDKRANLPFPTGVKEGGWTSWGELTKQPHFIVTGQTGSGKTNAMLAIISTLIAHHGADELQLVIGDLKEGVDLGMFKDVPQTIAVIEDIPTLAKAIIRMESIRAERMIELKRAGLRNINEYNKRHPDYKMPHLLFIVDEFGALASRQHKEQSQIIYDMAEQIAMKGRAGGIHLLIGAQTPRKEHVPPSVRDNITLRFSGRQQSVYASISATGSGVAANLPKIAGRFYVEDGADGYPVQMPEITNNEIDNAIKFAIETYEPIALVDLGLDDESSSTLGAVVVKGEFGTDNFIDIVLVKLDGIINYRAVFEYVRDYMPEYKLSLSQAKRIADNLKNVETVERRGVQFQIVSAGRGTGKKIQAIMDHDMSDTQEIHVIDDVNVNEDDDD